MPSRSMNLEREPSAASDFGVPTEKTVLLHQPEIVGELQRQLYIVGGEQDCLVLLVCQAAEHLKGFYLAGEIEEGGRPVENDDAGLLGKRLGYHRLLALAIAQLEMLRWAR